MVSEGHEFTCLLSVAEFYPSQVLALSTLYACNAYQLLIFCSYPKNGNFCQNSVAYFLKGLHV